MLVAVMAATAVSAAPAAAFVRPSGDPAANRAQRYFDVRDAARHAVAVRGDKSARRESAATRSARSALARRLGRQAYLDVDKLTGTARSFSRLDGVLAGPASGGARDVAWSFARANAAALGLSAADFASFSGADVRTTPSGITTVRWRQIAKGVPTFDNGLRVNLGRGNRVVSVQGSPVHGLSIASVTPGLSAEGALKALMDDTGVRRDARVTSRSSGVRRTTTFSTGDTARLVLFTGTTTRLAWSLTYRTADAAYHAVVDANSGRVLHRANLTKHAINTTVFDNHPGAPQGGTQQPRDMEALGYLPAGATTLDGPFARTWLDVNDDNAINAGENVTPGAYTFTAFSPAGNFCTPTALCSWNPGVRTSWQTNKNEAAVQAHYFVSKFHDHLASDAIGFTASDGNFEGVDRVEVNANDGADTAGNGGPDGDHVDNANMETFPDGRPPRMQMYLFEPFDGAPFRAINGDDSADILYHEYTHGLSNRLVVDDEGVGALNSPQSGAMGEGWSDWYAKDFLVRDGLQTDDRGVDGELDIGAYADGEPHQIRFEPIDCPVGGDATACPGGVDADEDGQPDSGTGGFTYGDFARILPFPEVHSDGEIWAQTLWDLRQALVAATGSETAGSDLAEQLITDGMRLSPVEPSMLDMRNAIIHADVAANGGANRAVLWSAFAGRGMGYFAAALDGNDVAPVEDFGVPSAPGAPTGTLAGTVSDSVSGLPLAGVRVGVVGHSTDSAFVDNFATTSAADGTYTLTAMPAGTYRKIVVSPPAGYEPQILQDVAVAAGSPTPLDLSARFDWASLAATASVDDTNDDFATVIGCGPQAMMDLSLGTGWSTFTSNSLDSQNPHPGAPAVATIELPRAIDVTAFGMDPAGAAACDDDPSSTTKGFKVETSTNGTSFTVAKQGEFAPEDAGRVNVVTPDAGAAGVKFVRLTLLSPQSAEAGESGQRYVDMTEFLVFGGLPNVLPTGTLTPSPSAATLRQIVSLTAAFTDPDSRITGYDWDFDGNGSIDQSTAGPSTTTSYTTAGTFSPRVFAKDFRGGSGTASTALAVGGGTPPPGARPGLRVLSSGKKGRLKFRVTCDSRCTGTAKLSVNKKTARRLKLGKRRAVGSVRFTLNAAGTRTVTVKLSKKALKAMRKAKIKRIKPTLKIAVTDAERQRRNSSKKVTIRR